MSFIYRKKFTNVSIQEREPSVMEMAISHAKACEKRTRVTTNTRDNENERQKDVSLNRGNDDAGVDRFEMVYFCYDITGCGIRHRVN